MSAMQHGVVYANEGNADALACVPSDAKRVLDIGCGAGDNARLLANRGCVVTGVTLNEREVELAQRYCDRVILADVEREELDLPEEGFDVIVLSHVLEHLRAPNETLRRLACLVPVGGKAIVAVPNMAHWRIRWQLAKGDWRRSATGPLDRTHLQFWSLKTASELLQETPFRLERLIPSDLAIPLWPLRRIAPRWSAKIDSFIGRRVPNLAAYQVILVARRIG